MNRAIDVWAQPANGLLRERVPEVARLFEKSGSGHLLDQRLSPEQTVALMDETGVEKLMLAAWCRPEGWAISNEEVAVYTRAFPDRFVGVATADLSKPVAAVRELERAVQEPGLQGPAHCALVVETAAQSPPVLPAVRQMHRAGYPVLYPRSATPGR